MSRTIFDRYGGFANVSRMVLDFYDRLLEDDDIGPYFETIDMARIVDHQTKFIATVLGGPVSYSDEQIRRMHQHLSITHEHFQKLRDVLAQTLSDHGMAAEDVAAVVDAFEQRRGLVVR